MEITFGMIWFGYTGLLFLIYVGICIGENLGDLLK